MVLFFYLNERMVLFLQSSFCMHGPFYIGQLHGRAPVGLCSYTNILMMIFDWDLQGVGPS